MTLAEKLAWLQEYTHDVSIAVNDHRSGYEPIEEAVEEQANYIDEETRRECIARRQLVVVQCYPNTPIGFHRVVHWDVTTAIDAMHEIIARDLGTSKPWTERTTHHRSNEAKA